MTPRTKSATPNSGLSRRQIKKLVAQLDRNHIQHRQIDGRTISYIEGWFAISEANAIFGFDGWDRETLDVERLYEQNRIQETQCAYRARVRVRVKAGSDTIIREGSGFAQATAPIRGDAHERALKAAETDATKRALATFGNRFGLSLYNKDFIAGGNPEWVGLQAARAQFSLKGPSGEIIDDDLSAEALCAGFRQMIDKVKTPLELKGLADANCQTLQHLRQTRPNLVSSKGVHFVDIIERLLTKRKEGLESGKSDSRALPKEPVPYIPVVVRDSTADGSAAHRDAPDLTLKHTSNCVAHSDNNTTEKIDKSVLQIGVERRVRSKAHLVFVGSQPCLICLQLPCHAHHLTFAQPRGLAVKVSDEYTVPLCPIHHNLLHQGANERAFWRQHGIDALQSAARLWTLSVQGAV